MAEKERVKRIKNIVVCLALLSLPLVLLSVQARGDIEYAPVTIFYYTEVIRKDITIPYENRTITVFFELPLNNSLFSLGKVRCRLAIWGLIEGQDLGLDTYVNDTFIRSFVRNEYYVFDLTVAEEDYGTNKTLSFILNNEYEVYKVDYRVMERPTEYEGSTYSIPYSESTETWEKEVVSFWRRREAEARLETFVTKPTGTFWLEILGIVIGVLAFVAATTCFAYIAKKRVPRERGIRGNGIFFLIIIIAVIFLSGYTIIAWQPMVEAFWRREALKETLRLFPELADRITYVFPFTYEQINVALIKTFMVFIFVIFFVLWFIWCYHHFPLKGQRLHVVENKPNQDFSIDTKLYTIMKTKDPEEPFWRAIDLNAAGIKIALKQLLGIDKGEPYYENYPLYELPSRGTFNFNPALFADDVDRLPKEQVLEGLSVMASGEVGLTLQEEEKQTRFHKLAQKLKDFWENKKVKYDKVMWVDVSAVETVPRSILDVKEKEHIRDLGARAIALEDAATRLANTRESAELAEMVRKILSPSAAFDRELRERVKLSKRKIRQFERMKEEERAEFVEGLGLGKLLEARKKKEEGEET